MTLRVNPEEWQPVGVSSLESRALHVVRSDFNASVIAGPGAGKTELLAQRASYLLQTGTTQSPRRILAISFKRDAAANLKQRVALRCGSEDAARFDSMTFDAFAKNLLDRFLPGLPETWRPSADYQLLFPTVRTFEDFLGGLAGAPDALGGAKAVAGISRHRFERDAVLGNRLPLEGTEPTTIDSWAAAIWWEQALRRSARSRLTFPMIGRLAELLLRANPIIRSALSLSYSHVFMDEFQDTTAVQFQLIETAFGGTDAVVTAVGDNKQQIMRWAMALSDAFAVFEQSFSAQRVQLLNNYRSSPELVRIQHVLASAIDEDADNAVSQVQAAITGESCAILEFPTRTFEAEYLAGTVKQGLESGLQPRDTVILVRQKANEYEEILAPAFRAKGMRLRNEARNIGNIALQDLLADHFVSVGARFLRVATTPSAGRRWTELRNVFEAIRGPQSFNEDDDYSSASVSGDIDAACRAFRARWPFPAEAAGPEEVVAFLLQTIGRNQLIASYPEYRQGNWLDSVADSMAAHLGECMAGAMDWSGVLDEFEGTDSVPLMTVHKSKGLEYHTVIFVGLDDSAWWNFKKGPDEGRATFFVAFSRAKQRVLFTFCEENGNRANIASLYDLLASAGVNTYKPLRQASVN